MIKLEAGKTYLDREGKKRGPLVHDVTEVDTIFEYSLGNGDFTWRKDGRVYNNSENIRDLIEEYIEVKEEPNTMTNYNDKNAVPDWNNGQIHGWNGGDCPVHPETVVKFWVDGKVDGECRAGKLRWEHKEHAGDIIAFRVVKEYVEPKVIWVNEYEDGPSAYTLEEKARHFAGTKATRVAVKYVEAIADAKECKE